MISEASCQIEMVFENTMVHTSKNIKQKWLRSIFTRLK